MLVRPIGILSHGVSPVEHLLQAWVREPPCRVSAHSLHRRLPQGPLHWTGVELCLAPTDWRGKPILNFLIALLNLRKDHRRFHGKRGSQVSQGPDGGEVAGDEILADSPASYSQIQIGDRLRMVSSACEESASAAQSVQASRIRRRRKKREKVGYPAGEYTKHMRRCQCPASNSKPKLPLSCKTTAAMSLSKGHSVCPMGGQHGLDRRSHLFYRPHVSSL